MTPIHLRPETPADIPAIRDINIAAFRDHPFSQQTEHLIVDTLRATGALEVSIVAVLDEGPVGHIAFSKATVGDADRWFLLGPVAVMPELHGQGIGSALVTAGLEALRSLGALGCVLVGDPAFYGRFGFVSVPGLTYEGVPDEYVLGLAFGEEAPHGAISADDAFLVEAEEWTPVTHESCSHVQGPFYHGTRFHLEVGEMLVPGRPSNFEEGRTSNNIYFSAELETAVWGAELATALAQVEGPGRIYVVEPQGTFEDDPNVTNKRFPGNPTRSYRTREPLKVVGEVEGWEGHSPEVLQGMLDALEDLRRQGLAIIED